MRVTRLVLVLGVVGLVFAPAGAQDLGGNRLANGGFEAGEQSWWHPRDAYGGELETQRRHAGVNCWRMELVRLDKDIYVSHGGRLEPGRDHQIGVWIRCQEVEPANAITIRALQFAGGKPAGWYLRDGSEDLIHTGGSHDWYQFTLNVPAGALKAETENLTIFLRARAGSKGTVWFDDVALRPIVGVAPGEKLDAQAASPLDLTAGDIGHDDAAAYRDIPFLDPVGEGISIQTGSDSNVFTTPEPVTIRIEVAEAGPLKVDWMVSDYYGREVRAGTAATGVDLAIPELGYFEVAASATRDGRLVGAARTSLAHLARHPAERIGLGYPFGSWVQQSDLLDEIGARWTRVGTGWRWLEPKQGEYNNTLWENQDKHIAGLVARGIRPIYLFAKVPQWAGPHHKRVGSEHWDDFRSYVRRCVERYRDQVDVWEVMNEPYIPTLFPGTLDEILRWHRIVREEVDRGDPGGQVIGPCLNPRADYLFKEQRQLLELGLGKLVDGIAIHTYGGLEAAGYGRDLARVREQWREFDAEKPLYITEQGLSVPEELPAERRQAQYLARMVLLCLEADVRAVIWHMMSWPQGGSAEQREFAIVRARKDLSQRAPRPAFVAAATLADVLGRARLVKMLDRGPTVGAQLYDDEGAGVLALWEWGRPESDLTINVGKPEVTLVDIVGLRRRVKTVDGRLELTLTPDPIYVIGVDPAAL